MQTLTALSSGVTVGAWWKPAEIGGWLPIVVLTWGRNLLLAVAADLLQLAGDIWSDPATVNHPDTAEQEHIVLTNQTRTDYSGVSVWALFFFWLLPLGCRLTNVHLSRAGSVWAIYGMQGTNTTLIYPGQTREALRPRHSAVWRVPLCCCNTLQVQSAISNTPDTLSKKKV